MPSITRPSRCSLKEGQTSDVSDFSRSITNHVLFLNTLDPIKYVCKPDLAQSCQVDTSDLVLTLCFFKRKLKDC